MKIMLKRHYQILELISHEARWFSFQEIADTADCSMKTIQRDVKYLVDFLPVDWKIIISKCKGIKLIIPNSSSIESFQSIYFKQSLLFLALEHLFYNDISTSKELLERFYITPDGLKSLFLEIKQYLKKYHLILNKRPLKIIGNEIDIILM
ncbi:helix-turn-helix domain-containing protein, partial [Bacillus cereus]|uniref:helix-turn-helix domain-containing protein n=1 Tax=Bacillus cereus TaxID=1396 RepID=UPI0009CFC48B